MESPGNTLALRLVGQEVWSPSRETGARLEASCFPSVTSSPCSASSICSTTFLVNYGADMNRDFAVITLLEEKLGREVEHEELQAAIANFRLVHGQLPSIRQLVFELASRADGHRCREDAESAACFSPNTVHLPGHPCGHHDEGAPPLVMSRDEHCFQGSLRVLHGQGTQLGLESQGPLARLCSPGARPQQGPSRFCPWDSPDCLATHLLQRQFERECTVPSPAIQQTPFLGPNADPDGPGALNMAADALDMQQPVARPFVPGLNLRGLKKKSPLLRAGASPPAASGNATPVQHVHAPGIDGASNDEKAFDTCSPTEILRMLLPSAWLRQITPMKEPQVTKSDANPGLLRHRPIPMTISSVLEKDQCTTPVPRGRRSHLHDQLDQGLHHMEYHMAATASLHGTAKRHISPPEQSNACNVATASNTCGTCSLVDSDVGKDTPSKFGAAVATARLAAGPEFVMMNCTQPEYGALPRPVVSATGAADQGMSQHFPQLQGVAVPPLRLPVPYPPVRVPGGGATQPSTRRRPWSTNSIPSSGPTVRVPQRPLSPADWGSRREQPPPTGVRTQRLSVCLPSAMVYGEGPLTTRRMAVGANSGVTSHALCTGGCSSRWGALYRDT
ncbi:hypothetical protein Vretifemale_7849, partial [Volvox reticuliferus]